MNRAREKSKKSLKDRLFLVEGNQETRRRLTDKLKDDKWRVVWASSAGEAGEILRDASFLDLDLDALLISYDLPDATATRVIQDFHAEWPAAPVGLMMGFDTIAVNVWAHSRNVRFMQTPLSSGDLDQWLLYAKTKTQIEPLNHAESVAG
jgi:DNA-binding NtrC family response regulator